eukprot:g3624.t1
MSDDLWLPPSKRIRMGQDTLTVQKIAEDKLTTIAKENWSSTSSNFSTELVTQIYASEFASNGDSLPNNQRVTLLEMSQFLERYLWPNFDPDQSSREHLLSIILMLNEKFRQRTSPWDAFGGFFDRVVDLELNDCTIAEKWSYIVFLTNCFLSLETEFVRSPILKLVSLPLWHSLSQDRRRLEFQQQPSLLKKWNRFLKKQAKHELEFQKQSQFLLELINEYFKVLKNAETGSLEGKFCERFVAFLVDLLSQLPTRRFLRVLLQDQAIVLKSKMAGLFQQASSQCFCQLVHLLDSYLHFNVDDHTGEPLSDEELLSKHYEKLTQLQRLLFKYWNPELKDYAMMDCANLQKPKTLEKLLNTLTHEEMKKLVVKQLKLINGEDPWTDRSEFLKQIFINHFTKRKSEREEISLMPTYPIEDLLWDPNKIPEVHTNNDEEEQCIPIGKLNLQFLSFHDYLLRNHQLFLLEAAYEVREEIHDVLDRLGERRLDNDRLLFKGWARMATVLESFKITEVANPKLGELKAASVKAEIIFNTQFMREEVRKEWNELREFEVLFLLAFHPPGALNSPTHLPHGLRAVRGCEILDIRDEQGKTLNVFSQSSEDTPPVGFKRTLLVSLDSAQYQKDKEQGLESVYNSFSVLLRRKPKENNFKSVLENVRDLMSEKRLELNWLHDVFLGYGLPTAAHYTHLEKSQILTLDFKNTFMDWNHLKTSFPNYEIQTNEFLEGYPMELSFSSLSDSAEHRIIQVKSYSPGQRAAKKTVRFTPVQIQSILAGLQPGLSLIVGPPGTGKTDTAVQILFLLFHNFLNERTLLITHSNQALNDLFQKLMDRDIPGRYLLRLGLGEEDLETDLDFSRVGRVNAMLQRRLALLSEIKRLAKGLNVSEDMAYSCETAGHFWLLHVLSRWEKFLSQCQALKTKECVKDLFPFQEYFSNSPEPLFQQMSYEEDLETAKSCFKGLKTVFSELEECRAFELLRSQSDRVNYLITKQAKIVAMTCTHAALKRKEFLSIGLQYDNILMEEAAQILEIEAFIPLTLQRKDDGSGVRVLKRLVLIGDHNQLPPVVKHPGFQNYCQMDQSLFSRLIRLGVPYLQLDAQGRSRKSLAKLFNWRYDHLADLPAINNQIQFQLSNAGFAFEFQFVDVDSGDGSQETTPTPYFYQNLAEAEYLVKVYQFMRLIGYPSKCISILTTYNGQKRLLEDILARHCGSHEAFGLPHKVATVDKTRAFGHLRDVRRLIVAMSRAQLGLYIFGNAELYKNCYEMQPVYQQWMTRPTKLALVKSEGYGNCSRKLHEEVEFVSISGLEQMSHLVEQMTREWELHIQEVKEKEDSNPLESMEITEMQ